MSHQRSHEILSVILGALTATGVGSFLFQAFGAILLGILGALGGYVFTHFLKPKLDKLFKKKS